MIKIQARKAKYFDQEARPSTVFTKLLHKQIPIKKLSGHLIFWWEYDLMIDFIQLQILMWNAKYVLISNTWLLADEGES